MKITVECAPQELVYFREQNQNNRVANEKPGKLAQVYFACMQPFFESAKPPAHKINRPVQRIVRYLTK